MWWYYIKIAEDDKQIQYSYARESRETSGIVGYIKGTDEVMMIKPASMDDTKYSQERALQHLYNVKRRGFPDSVQIACG